MKLLTWRRPWLVACSLVLSGAALACSGTGTRAAAPALAPRVAPDAGRLYADVAWLADDAREGRRSGEPGNDASAEWLAGRLRALGLEPAGEQGSFFQEFALELAPRDGGGSWIELPGAGTELRAESDPTRLVPLFCSEGGEAVGPLVFAGFGIDYQGEQGQRDDFAGLECTGAVVWMVRGAPRAAEANTSGADASLGAKSAEYGSSTTLFAKVMAAKRRGALAVLITQHPDEAGTPLLAFDAGQSARAGIPALMLDLQAATLLLPNYSEWVRANEAGSAAPAPQCEPRPTIRLLADVRREKGHTRNVLGLLRGRDAARTVLLGAHFDHLGFGGAGSLASAGTHAIHNGADDNASGTAAVLEAARLLCAGAAPEGDVLIALWSGEEEGLLGSEHWAQQPTLPLARLRAVLNYDMVGRAGDGSLQVLGAGTAAQFPAWLEAAGPAAQLRLEVSQSGQGLGGSDHQSFLKRQIPALHFFSGVHTDYHKPSDDLARFEAKGAAHSVELGLYLLARIQQASELCFQQPSIPEASQGAPDAPRASSWRSWFGSVPEYGWEGVGLKLSGTSEGSPAERAGLLAGDVLTQLGDIEIKTIYDFVYALQVYKPGDTLLARYLRDGQAAQVRVTLATRALE